MKKALLFISVCIATVGFGQAQKSKLELKGDKLYFIFGYHEAIKKYEKTIIKDSLTSEGLRKLADSYLKTGNYVKAEEKYAELVKKPEATANDFYVYADVLKNNGKYKESEASMKTYFGKAPNEIRSKTNQQLLDKIENLKTDKGFFSLTNMELNTEKQEFAPALYGDKMVYSANAVRHDGMIIKNYIWENTAFLDMFVYDPMNADSGAYHTEFKPKFNKKFHEGVVCFSSDLKRMYYTSNNYEQQALDGSYNLEIFWTEVNDAGEWGDPVPFEYNSPEFSVGHPYVTKDGKTMYFISNMPGGFGGTDLYKCTMTKDGVWGNPENLGAHINTEGDELFPFFHDEKQILFFSSNGLFGLGGLDIFAVSLKNGKFGKINNFGAPLNSQYDDFGIVIDPKMKEGYFSSNRTNGKGNDDIYALKILKDLKPEEYVLEKQINGIVRNTEGKPLSGAKVDVYDDKNNLVKSVVSGKDGKFTVKGFENQKYTMITNKEYYQMDTSSVSTETEELTVNTEIKLNVKEEIIIVDNVAFIKVQTIYFDVNSSALREDTKDKLANVIKIMNENPTMEVELGSHTDCRGTARYNMKLSQERANSSVNYIRQYITNPERIRGVGYGETQLVNNCPCERKVESTCSEEEHQANRRTEFKIINKNTMDNTIQQETPVQPSTPVKSGGN